VPDLPQEVKVVERFSGMNERHSELCDPLIFWLAFGPPVTGAVFIIFEDLSNKSLSRYLVMIFSVFPLFLNSANYFVFISDR
jgi:hypothetical protein